MTPKIPDEIKAKARALRRRIESVEILERSDTAIYVKVIWQGHSAEHPHYTNMWIDLEKHERRLLEENFDFIEGRRDG